MPDETVGTHGWDPDQYSKFAAERAKPFFDLLAMVDPVPGGDVIDLGCGTGELDCPAARTHQGRDDDRDGCLGGHAGKAGPLARVKACASSSATSAASQPRQASTSSSPTPACSGCPIILGCCDNLPRACVPEVSWPSRSLPMGTTRPMRSPRRWRREEPFLAHMGADPAPGVHPVCTPEKYAELLDGIGFCDQHVRLQVYGHRLDSTSAVVEWTKGTTLLRFKSLLQPCAVRPVHGALPATAGRGARRAGAVLLHVQAHPLLGTASRTTAVGDLTSASYCGQAKASPSALKSLPQSRAARHLKEGK